MVLAIVPTNTSSIIERKQSFNMERTGRRSGRQQAVDSRHRRQQTAGNRQRRQQAEFSASSKQRVANQIGIAYQIRASYRIS